MKIAFIGLRGYPANFDGLSGVDVRAEKIITNLSKKNQIDIYIREWNNNKIFLDQKNIKLINVFSIKNKYLDSLIYGIISSIMVIFSPAKIIFIETTNFGFFLLPLKLTKKKIVLTIHSLEWKRKKWNQFTKIFLKISEIISIKLSNKIITISNLLSNYLINNYKEKNKVIVIPHFFIRKKCLKPKIIKKYGLEKENYLLYLGRITPEKRIEWLIKAYNDVTLKQKLVIVGLKTVDNQYYQRIRNLIKGSKNKIIYIHGLFNKEKNEIISNCLLFINPSEFEGSSVSLLEALEYNRKVLISDILENKEIVKNQNHLFKVTNFEDFKSKIQKLLNKNDNKLNNQYFLNSYINKNQFFAIYNEIN